VPPSGGGGEPRAGDTQRTVTRGTQEALPTHRNVPGVWRCEGRRAGCGVGVVQVCGSLGGKASLPVSFRSMEGVLGDVHRPEADQGPQPWPWWRSFTHTPHSRLILNNVYTTPLAGTLHSFLELPDGPAAAAGGAAAHAAAPAAGGGGGAGRDEDVPLAKRTRHGATAGGAEAAGGSAAADVAALAARRSEYMSVMKPLQFREVSLLADHCFRCTARPAGSTHPG
jgi:hypothetical protein